MKLSNTLLSEFADVISKNNKTRKSETITYGTIVEENDSMYVELDGSEIKTPVLSTADIRVGDRVIVMIKNHTATITGNLTSPSAGVEDVKQATTDSSNASAKVKVLESMVQGMSDAVDTNSNEINNLQKNIQSLVDTDAEHAEEILTIKEDSELIKEDIELIKEDIELIKKDLEEIKSLLTTT